MLDTQGWRCYHSGYSQGVDHRTKRTAATRIITESRLTAFWKLHPEAEAPLKEWRRIIRLKEYRTPHQVRADFPAADFLKAGTTVFDIGGNKYRLVVTMRYDLQRVYIRHVLTHKEYDRKSHEGTL